MKAKLINAKLPSAIKTSVQQSITGMFSNQIWQEQTGGNLEIHNLSACVVALKEK